MDDKANQSLQATEEYKVSSFVVTAGHLQVRTTIKKDTGKKNQSQDYNLPVLSVIFSLMVTCGRAYVRVSVLQLVFTKHVLVNPETSW